MARSRRRRRPQRPSPPQQGPKSIGLLIVLSALLLGALIFWGVVLAPHIFRKQPVSGPVDAQELDKQLVEVKFFELCLTHPKAEFQKFYTDVILTGNIRINFDRILKGRALGQFGVQLGKPVLNLNPFALQDIVSKRKPQKEGYITLWHEYIHYRQWMQGLVPARFLDIDNPLNAKTISQREVEFFFEMEYLAYLEEAKLDLEFGGGIVTAMTAKYMREGERGLRKSVASIFAESGEWKPHLKVLQEVAERPPQPLADFKKSLVIKSSF